MNVQLISVTPDAEHTIAYIARVSNPENQDNPNYERLISYCIRNKHWSVFEQAYMTIEIETSIAIATQILRHRSFTFQQFSQRYQDPTRIDSLRLFEPFELREQATKNRQSSLDKVDAYKEIYYNTKINFLLQDMQALYLEMVNDNIAKECARFILPQCTKTKMYMTGNCRSWIHYIELRTNEHTQKEHRYIAEECKQIFVEQFPQTAKALEWI